MAAVLQTFGLPEKSGSHNDADANAVLLGRLHVGRLESTNFSEKLTAFLRGISECHRTADVFILTVTAWRRPV